DAFAGDAELLADFFERMVGVHADAEAHAENAFLARGERGEDTGRRLAEVRLDRRVDRQDRVLVLDEIAEVAVLLVADRRLEADRLLGDLEDLADLLERHGELLGKFLRGRLAADLVEHLAAGADDLVDRLDHVDGDADRARLIGDRARDRLPDPPGGIGREFVAAAVLELVDRLHQADVSFLDEVEELQAAVRIFLGDRDDQAEVRLDHLLLRLAGLALALLHHVDDAAELGRLEAGFGGERLDLLPEILDALLVLGDEFLPAAAGEVGDAAEPVRVELGPLVFLEEILAADAVGFGKAEQPAFVADQALVDVVELLDQRIDAVLVERQGLHRRDDLLLQLLVAALLGGGERGVLQLELDVLVLQATELLVEVGDVVEGGDDALL